MTNFEVSIPKGLEVDKKRHDKLVMAINTASTVSKRAHDLGELAPIYVTFCAQGKTLVYRVNGWDNPKTIAPLKGNEAKTLIQLGTAPTPEEKRVGFGSNWDRWDEEAEKVFQSNWTKKRANYLKQTANKL